MTKGGHENAVIGNLDDPIALDTRLEHVGATGRVLLHLRWMLHLRTLGLWQRWDGGG